MSHLADVWARRNGVGLRLAGLVVACIAPLCVAAGVILHDAYQQRRASIERHMVEAAGVMVMSLVDGALGDVRSALNVLALSSHLETGDMERFHAQARRVAGMFPGADVIMADRTGQQIVNTYRDFGGPLPRRNAPDLVRRVFETGKPTVGDVFLGALTRRALVAVDVPVVMNGETKYDLSMTFPAERLGVYLQRYTLPPGWAGVALDARGGAAVVIGDYAGKPGEPLPIDLSRATEGEPWRFSGADGRPTTAAFAASADTGWRAVVFAPTELVDGALRDWLAWASASAAGLLLLGVGLALRVATGIARSIRRLEGRALALGREEKTEFTPSGLSETDSVVRAIAHASGLLAQRSDERDRAEAALLDRSRRLQRRHDGMRTLNDVAASPESAVDKLLTAALAAGVAHLGLKIGLVSRVKGRRYTLLRHVAPPEMGLEDGAVFDTAETYCALTIEADAVIAVSHMGRSSHAAHLCYRRFGLESYIGAPLKVDGEIVGAVSFLSPEPTAEPFDEGDEEFVLLLARWLGAMLERDAAASALERSNAELDQFAYIASHDLREPLRRLTTYATLLERRLEGKLDEETQSYLVVVRDGAMRMNRLILDMLDYSMIGRHERPFTTVGLSRAASDAGHRIAADIAAVDGRIDGGDALPTVAGDYAEMVRLFTYLFDNAVKFAAPDRPPVVALSSSRRPDGWWEIIVADNGVGVESIHFDRIFLIFQTLRVDEAAGGGAGIGLAGARKIVERHGGRIWIDSTPGVGSRFHFTLPPAPETGAERP